MIAVARVLDVANGGTTVTVSLLGSAGITLPATASTWTGVETAYVLLDPDTGRPIHVLGPAPAPKTGPMSFSPPEATTNTVTCTAHPTWTGTHAPTGWNRFSAAIVGHPRDLNQGDAGTGTLTGLATYGQQIPAIGTTSITRATLTATGNGANPNTWNAVLQCATYTDAGPQPTGPQAPTTITSNNTSPASSSSWGVLESSSDTITTQQGSSTRGSKLASGNAGLLEGSAQHLATQQPAQRSGNETQNREQHEHGC